jgi:GH25 family lysozyme M1 (1,4-beta-N-acetylmuramidase)
LVAGCAGAHATHESSGTTSSAATVCAGGSTLEGLDVSDYDGTVNWTEVASSGRSFAIARISDGTGYPDSTFAANWAGMKSAGLIRGSYQFFRASEDPTAQANMVIAAVGTLGAGDLAPVADVEVMDGESGATLVAHLATWISVVAAATGRTPIIYSDPGFWNALPDTSQFANDVIWVANWGTSCPEMPTPWTGWSLWQYSDTGSVPGVNDAADLDRFNGTLAQLQALASGAAPVATPPTDGGTSASGCYSSTLGKNVSNNACVDTDASGDGVQCDSGTWVNRYDDPSPCSAVYPYSNGGHSSGGGAGCYSSTLGATEPDNACVQSKSDNAWYQCDDGSWVDRWTDPTACNGVYPL